MFASEESEIDHSNTVTFYPSLDIATAVMVVLYLGMVMLLKRVGIHV